MAIGSSSAVVAQVERLFGPGTVSGLSEGQLLERFVTRRDEAAFEALVLRHGPMVQGLCRRILRDRHEAEDAFQATFLVLARKAGAIRSRDRLGPWLYRVAHRVALRASRQSARRNERERPDAEAAERALDPNGSPVDPDLAAAVHAELARLPERYRAAVVLCDLQGLTHEEAAFRLRWPLGTVKGRLSRARDRLRDRLSRRGLAAPVGVLAALLAREARGAVPVSLLDSTVKVAAAVAAGGMGAGLASGPVAALAEGVGRAMTFRTIQTTALAVMFTSGLLTASGLGLAAVWQDVGGGGGNAPGAAAAGGGSNPVSDDLNALQGDWRRVSSEVGGKAQMEEPNDEAAIRLVIEGSTWTFAGQAHSAQLDPNRSPREIVLVTLSGDRPVALQGIYKLEGDRLTLCLVSGDGRPEAFQTAEGDGRFLDVYERVAEKAAGEAPEKPEVTLAGRWEELGVSGVVDGARRSYSTGILVQATESEIFMLPKSENLSAKAKPVDGTPTAVHRLHERLSYVLHPGANGPFAGEIDLTPPAGRESRMLSGSAKRRPFPGIYSISGASLTLCYNDQGGPRPESLEGQREGDVSVVLRGVEMPELAEAKPRSPGEATKAQGDSTPGEEAPTSDEHHESHAVRLDVARNELRLLEDTVYDLKEAIDATAKEIREVDPVEMIRLGTPVVGGEEAPRTPEEQAERDRIVGLVAKLGDLKAEYAKRLEDVHRGRLAVERLASEIGEGTPTPGISDKQRTEMSESLAGLRREIKELEDSLAYLQERRNELRRRLDDYELAMRMPAGLRPAVSHEDSPLPIGGSEGEMKRAVEVLRDLVRENEHLCANEVGALLRAKRNAEAMEKQLAAPSLTPRKIKPGDVLQIEVLEALPGRPLSGERIVRPDGTVSLEFYGDLYVAGLDRNEIKVKLLRHMQRYLTDDVLGLVSDGPGDGRVTVNPLESDRVFVDESPTLLRERSTEEAGEE